MAIRASRKSSPPSRRNRSENLSDKFGHRNYPRIAGHGPTLFAGLSKPLDLKLVSRLEFGSGAVAMWYVPLR